MRSLWLLVLLGCGREVARAPAEVCPPAPEAPEITLTTLTESPRIDPFATYSIVLTLVVEAETTVVRANRRWMRLLSQALVLLGPRAPWPRLADRGLEGMTTKEMASLPVMQRAFSGAQIVEDRGDLEIRDADDTELATVYVRDGASDMMRVTGPGIETVHGLQIGMPLAKVLKLRVPHRCETRWRPIHSGAAMEGAIRCWVGRGERFRYVAQLGTRSTLGRGLLGDDGGIDVPHEGRALARWIEETDPAIDLILWER